MQNSYYDMIFKRKSFHMFREVLPLSQQELAEINEMINNVTPLCDDIKIKLKLVPKQETSCKRGEYCILIYSESKGNFLQNAGYVGQQLDLWLASKDIGVCWYGLAKAEETQCDGLDFVIMLAIGKTQSKYFRKDYTKCSRCDTLDICDKSMQSVEVMNVAKYAPSACNSQPWFVEYNDNTYTLSRTRGKKGIVPADKMSVINRVDIGIITLFLELYFEKNNIKYTREVYQDIVLKTEKALDINQKVINIKYKIIT